MTQFSGDLHRTSSTSNFAIRNLWHWFEATLYVFFNNPKRNLFLSPHIRSNIVFRFMLPYALRALFFFSLTRGSCMRPAEKKNEKKHTEHERVQCLGTTEHERGPYTHATRQKTHTEHERVPYTHATRCTQRYKSTYTYWKDVIHYTKIF